MNTMPQHDSIVKVEVYDDRPPLHQLRRVDLWNYAKGIIEYPAGATKDDMIVLIEAAWANVEDFSRRPKENSEPPSPSPRHVKYRGRAGWCVMAGETVISKKHETKEAAEEVLHYG